MAGHPPAAPPPPLVPPDPPLTDGVVLLRPWTTADVDQLVAACQDPDTQRFIPLPLPYGEAEARQYVERTVLQWADGTKAAFAIVDPADPAHLLGAVNVARFGSVGNSGYWVAPEARGRGVARRALHLVAEWALHHLDIGVVLLEIRPENDRSVAVARAAGFHEAGHLDVNDATGEHDGLLYVRMVSDPPAS